MKRSLLPLTALRAFKAAGRHQSFKSAADELAVSEAAISRQIRDLEQRLDIALFVRHHRAVRLTDTGHKLLTQLTASFDAIQSALTAAMAPSTRQKIVVSVEPTFASLFLIPRLTGFTSTYPGIDVQIDVSAELTDLRSDGPNLAIRHSLAKSSWPRASARHLLNDSLTPMLAPGLTKQAISTTLDLLKLRLLRDENDLAWMRWLTAAGVSKVPDWGPIFSNAAIAIQGAELAQGVVLGSRALAAQRLEAGALYAPFELEVANGAYWLVTADFDSISQAEADFCGWLASEVASVHRDSPTYA